MFVSPLVAFCVVALFASAGILDSFSRGIQSAAIHNINRPQQKPLQPTEQTLVNKLTNNSQQHTKTSSTLMPTLSGGQQRVDLCEGNIIVPLLDGKEKVTYKSTRFPYKRSVPLFCSWIVKVDNKCRRGLVTMVINERSRLSGERRCTKGYYRVFPFMKEAKICGRINMVPAFQWYVEDQQPENVTIILKHNGLDDGYSEGLGFTLSGECLTDASDMTTSKAIKSYNQWLHELSKSQSAETGGLTVVLPFIALDSMPLDESVINETAHIADASNDAVIEPLQNHTESQAWLPDNSTNTSIVLSEAFQDNFNQTLTVTLVENNVTAPVNLTTTFSNVTQISNEVVQSTKPIARPSSANDGEGPGYTVDFKVLEDDGEIPWPIVTSLKADLLLSKIDPTIHRRQPITKRPAPSISYGNNADIPWLILKSNDPNPSISTTRPPVQITPPPIPLRRPLPINARPAIQRWPIGNFIQTNDNIPSFIRPNQLKIPVRRPTSSVDDEGIPWLILKSSDVNPSSLETYYPESPSNELTNISKEDEDDRFSSYSFSKG